MRREDDFSLKFREIKGRNLDERTDDSEIYIMINLTERDVRREKK